MNKNVYSVSQVTKYIAGLIDEDFLLSDICVTGEVSSCAYPASGHVYFTLKDEDALIDCVIYKSKQLRGLKFQLKKGDKVVVKGKVGIYVDKSKYQLYADSIELAGIGVLHQRFEALKAELEELGMFSPIYKKSLPNYVMKIGVVTSPTGAVIRDIINVSKNRNPYVQIILYPALVQGEGAIESIVSGINYLDKMNLDVLIVGRGGGSLEDLWAFNEEAVARAIFNADTPIVSAVGHETDTTIADLVADVRASTPSHAAEIVNFVYQDFQDQLNSYFLDLNKNLQIKTDLCEEKIKNYKLNLYLLRPDKRLKDNQAKLESYLNQIEHLMDIKIEYFKNIMKNYSLKLEGLSPAKKLAAGFGYVTDGKGDKLISINQVNVGDTINIRINDGNLTSTVTDVSGFD